MYHNLKFFPGRLKLTFNKQTVIYIYKITYLIKYLKVSNTLL